MLKQKAIQLTAANIANKFSLACVQMKFSMKEKDGRYNLTKGDELGDWIIKTPSTRHPFVPLNEFTAMSLATLAGTKQECIPLVLHGASGVPEDEVRAAIAAGVHKFNADTDLRRAFRSGIEAVWADGDRQLEEAMAEGRRRMVAATADKIRLYGCAGATRRPAGANA